MPQSNLCVIILLQSLTTMAGMMPVLFETSTQA
jgi:hypothetical protein